MKKAWHMLKSISCVVAVLVIGGCGGGVRGVNISGQVVQNGKSIKILAKEEINVGFSSTDTAGDKQSISCWAPISPADGAFTFTGPSGRGISGGDPP